MSETFVTLPFAYSWETWTRPEMGMVAGGEEEGAVGGGWSLTKQPHAARCGLPFPGVWSTA
ncbi:hypothetical protein ACHAW5_002727 [Stephanodiscus triporus]|uniref:Uncharacterized protein n=1 Tax=Stephanodiscus triporus TaxID=2934178 RepID=A0ABD3MH78_9STRA